MTALAKASSNLTDRLHWLIQLTVAVAVVRSEKLVAKTPEEGKRPLLEAVTMQRLVKTEVVFRNVEVIPTSERINVTRPVHISLTALVTVYPIPAVGLSN
jgi:hypothetical protein